MQDIAVMVTRAIREKKWLQIEYDNVKEKRCTYFWICILDIVSASKKLKVHMFNQEYSYEVIKDGWLFYDQIRYAEVIEGTSYEVDPKLYEKLQHHYKEFDFLSYTSVDERILQYYLKCYQQDRDASVTKYHLVSGIDADMLQGKRFVLKPQQFETFVMHLKLYQKQKKRKYKQKIIKLAINIVSIHNQKGLYPIVYRDVLLDIERKELIASQENSYNGKLDSENGDGSSFSLRRYYDGDIEDFKHDFEQHREDCLRQLNENLRRHEQLDEHPYMFKLEQNIPINIEKEYLGIWNQYDKQKLSAPLRCFFGINEKEKKRKPRSILIAENQINTDQLRSVFNAMTNDVVYVQGPPGTGKTRTIINVILSCLLNHMTALIVSNNNEAINNIYRKISTYQWQNEVFSLPVLRLGSNENINATLCQLHQHVKEHHEIESIRAVRFRIKELKEILQQDTSEWKKYLSAYEEQSERLEQLDSLKQIIADIEGQNDIDEISKRMAIQGIRAQIQNLMTDSQHLLDEQQLLKYNVSSDDLMEFLYESSRERFYRLTSKKYQELYDIIMLEDEKERLLSFRSYLEDERKLMSLLEVFPFIISTNISVTKLGKPEPVFDLMIMDEASQCNNAQALLPMARCKRALFVGDQNQLQPVILLNQARNNTLMQSFDIPIAYSYKDNSILSTLLRVDTLSKFILLREHFRCHNKIISFANQKYYDNELKLCCKLNNVDALKLIDVKALPEKEKNISHAEIEALLQELKSNRHKEIAVITPFRKQADLIEHTLLHHGFQEVKVGTIHTFQGDEKDRIILCAGIAENMMPKSFNWMKNNQQLINVATTRAKENLTLICDVRKVKALSGYEKNDFLELVNYIKSDGDYEVAYRENEVFTSKVKNFKYYNVQTEEQLLKTLLHIRSVYGQINIRNRVEIMDVLSLQKQERLLFHRVFDFVIYDLAKHPLVAIELSGSDHYSPDKMKERQRRKQEICERNHLKLISIGTDYVRRYTFIKQAILEAISN